MHGILNKSSSLADQSSSQGTNLLDVQMDAEPVALFFWNVSCGSFKISISDACNNPKATGMGTFHVQLYSCILLGAWLLKL